MLFMPFNVLGIWLRGLFSLALLGGAAYLLTQWYNRREVVVTEPVVVDREEARPGEEAARAVETRTRVVRWEFGLNRESAFLLGGLGLLAWSVGGGWLLYPRLLRRRGSVPPMKPAALVQKVSRPGGGELRVRCYGPQDGTPLVLIHGWGLDSEEWRYAVAELGGRHRLILWDLPGLGESSRPPDRDWSLEKLARDLDAVLALAEGRPAVLVGHSIGGMIILTYCRLFPETLGQKVCGLVLAHSTYTNPVRTTARPGLYSALQKPVLEPLCHLMVWLAPLVRVMSWLSYLNGSAHRSTERGSFSGEETRGQLDFMAGYYCTSPPDVIGRGMLALFDYDATSTLGALNVPTLIVAGDGDRTCTPEASRFMAETIPDARLVVLGPARHCGLFEKHERFHAAVAEFLEEASRPARGASTRRRGQTV